MEASSQRRMMENKPQTEKTMRVARLQNTLVGNSLSMIVSYL